MSPKFPAVTDKEVIIVLKKLGFEFYRQAKGSHEVWRNREGHHTIIPRHAGQIIKRRTLKAILNDTGVSVKKFQEILQDN